MSRRHTRVVIAVVLILGVGAWYWLTAGRESTDGAQVDAHVTPIAFRIPGTVLRVHVSDNKPVEAGTVLVELDPRDYEVAVAKARAELGWSTRPLRETLTDTIRWLQNQGPGPAASSAQGQGTAVQ